MRGLWFDKLSANGYSAFALSPSKGRTWPAQGFKGMPSLGQLSRLAHQWFDKLSAEAESEDIRSKESDTTSEFNNPLILKLFEGKRS